MKSRIVDNRYYIECECMVPHCNLIFDIYEDSEDKECSEIYVTVGSVHKKPLWYKIRDCFRYLFKQEKYLGIDGVNVTYRNIEQLEEIIERIKIFKKNNDHLI